MNQIDCMKSIALVPAFNEEKTIREVITRLKNVNLNSIVVDDGSVDKTDEIAKKSGAIVIKHLQNKGKGKALKTGFKYISKNYRDVDNIVIVDSDLQYHPEESIRRGNQQLVVNATPIKSFWTQRDAFRREVEQALDERPR